MVITSVLWWKKRRKKSSEISFFLGYPSEESLCGDVGKFRKFRKKSKKKFRFFRRKKLTLNTPNIRRNKYHTCKHNHPPHPQLNFRISRIRIEWWSENPSRLGLFIGAQVMELWLKVYQSDICQWTSDDAICSAEFITIAIVSSIFISWLYSAQWYVGLNRYTGCTQTRLLQV